MFFFPNLPVNCNQKYVEDNCHLTNICKITKYPKIWIHICDEFLIDIGNDFHRGPQNTKKKIPHGKTEDANVGDVVEIFVNDDDSDDCYVDDDNEDDENYVDDEEGS